MDMKKDGITRFQQTLKRQKRQLSAFKVLVVDDEPSILNLLETALVAFEDFYVATAGTASDALKALSRAKNPFDCLLIDIQMPGKSGIELLREIRALPDYANTPIIMLTAMCERSYVDNAFLEGAVDYITKPFDLSDLRVRLNSVQTLSKERRNSASGESASVKPVQTALYGFDDAFPINGVPRLLGCREFDNYIAQLSRGRQFNSQCVAIKLQDASFAFEASSDSDFSKAIDCLALSISTCLAREDCMFSYRGRGVFLVVEHGRKFFRTFLNSKTLNQVFSTELKRCGLPSESALSGNSFSLRSLSKTRAYSALKMALESVEARQTAILGQLESDSSEFEAVGADQRDHIRKRVYEKVLIEMFRDETYLGKR